MGSGTLGYLCAAIAFFLLSALLFTAPLKSAAARLIRLFSITTLIWASMGAFMLDRYFPRLVDLLAIESVRNLFLQVVLITLLRGSRTWRELSRESLARLAVAMVVVVTIAGWAVGLDYTWSRMLVFGGMLCQVLLSLFLVEQNFRLLPAHARRPFVPFMLGVGAVLVFDFVLYAEGLLLLQLNPTFWEARGYVWAGVMPALLLTTRRLPALGVRIFVSRQVVYHSTLLMVAALYLLLMAATGYYIRYFGGDWGHVLQTAFLALASLILAAIFFSDAFRRKVKVFIFKHFYANRYDYRSEWLKLNEILHGRAIDEGVYVTALRAIATVVRAPSGYLYRRIGDACVQRASFPEAQQGAQFGPDQLKEIMAFCEREGWIIDVEEYAGHRHRYGDLKLDVGLCRSDGVALWVPIYDGDQVSGLFALGRHAEEPSINFEDRDLLNTVSSQLATYLSLQEASEALTEARQFDAFNRMSAFLMHDLKNIVAQLNLIVVNSKRHKSNPEFIDDSLETLANAVAKMQRIMQQLKKNDASTVLREAVVDFGSLVEAAVERQSVISPKPELLTRAEVRVKGDGERLLSVVANLIQNAQDATSSDARVQVSLALESGMVLLTIRDEGCGMSESFIRERLFRPFDTTKGNAGMGIGAYEARQLVLGLGGTFDVDSTEGAGTCITVRLPVHHS